MSTKKNNILGLIIFVGILSHFWLGYFHWDIIDGENGTDILYSITGYLLIDISGLVLFILCDHLRAGFLKLAGIGMMFFATYYMYMEFNDPYNWRVMDYKLFAVLGLSLMNLSFIYYFTDLMRKL